MALANTTFNLFNKAAGNAEDMFGQGGTLFNGGLGQMDQAASGFGTMAGAMPGAMQGYGQAQQGMGQSMGLLGRMGQQLDGATGAYNSMAGMTPGDVQGGTLPGTNLSGYMNPFQRDVIDATMGEIGRQQTMQDNSLQDQFQRAGAFGGDRMAVMQAENRRNFDQTRAQTLANLNFQNFNNAQGMATNDLNRGLQAAQGNQGTRAGMMQAGAAGLAGMAGQGASGLANMGQFGASGLAGLGSSGLSGLAGLGQSRAGMGQQQQQFGQQQMGGLSAQGFDMGQSLENRNMMAGTLQQQQMQSILDAIKAQTMGWQNSGDAGLARYFGSTQDPGGYGTSSGSTTSRNRAGVLGTLGTAAQIGGMFMGG